MRLLVMVHSRSGGTQTLADAVVAGAALANAALDRDEQVEVIVARPAEIDADAFRATDAVIVATPEHFGAMAGLVKDCFERVYHDIIDDTRGLPYALVVKGRHDGTGTVRGVQSIATGLGWKAVVPPLLVIGDVEDHHRDAATELGATVTAAIATGVS